jgi:hypothetical protein
LTIDADLSSYADWQYAARMGDMQEPLSALLFSVAAGLAIHAAIAFGLHQWAKAVARRRGDAFWRRAAWVPLVALTFVFLGTVITAVIFVRTFGAVATGDPALKAIALARGISEAMNVAALTICLSMVLYLGSAILSLVGWLGRARAPV